MTALARMRRRLADDGGISLVEMALASTLFLVIVTAVLASLDSGTRAERGARSRSDALVDVRAGVTRFTKDVRQATAISQTSSGSVIDMQTMVLGAPVRLVYDVTDGALRRTVCTNLTLSASCGGTASVLVERVTSAAPFCYNPPGCTPTPPASVSAVRIALAGMPDVQATRPVTLTTDIQLRNL